MKRVLLALLFVVLSAAPASADVVVAVPGLAWDDVDETATPNLWRLAREGAVGVLSVRSEDEHSTPEEGRAVLLAGDRDEVLDPLPVPLVELPAVGTVPIGEIDRMVGEHLGDPVVLVVGSSDLPGGPPRLRVAIARGPDFPRGVLRSASTRRDGYVQLIDVAPTVLGADPDRAGQPMRRVPGSLSVGDLRDMTRAADAHRERLPAFFAVFGAVQLGFYLVARRRVLRRGALLFLAVPAALYLVQLAAWWRYGPWYLYAVVAAIASLVATAASRVPGRIGPVGAVAGFTALVIAGDLATGGWLQMNSLAGYSPIVAGRFAGLGNVAFAVFATACLLTAAAWPRAAVPVGLAAVVVDGHPALGSDFGGVLALVPAFAVLAGRSRWTPKRVAAVAGAAFVAVACFALLDYARPTGERSHLGRFAQRVADGDAGDVLRRKAETNWELVTHSPLTVLTLVVAAGLAYLVVRPRGALARAYERAPVLRTTLLAVVVLAVAGFLANDSGLGVPVFAAIMAVPATMWVIGDG